MITLGNQTKESSYSEIVRVYNLNEKKIEYCWSQINIYISTALWNVKQPDHEGTTGTLK